ncbi:MAG: YbaB/EbfC family nucleoid-associated protein, partial [Pseudomonadota bacterium]
MKIAQMMQQAQEMQSRFQSMQDQLNEQDVEGAAGGGLVRVRISLKGDVREIKIDPELLKPDEVEVLEDLLKAAFAQARARA